MIKHPGIRGRRVLVGEIRSIYDDLLSIVARLDLLDERDVASDVLAAVERLVDAPRDGGTRAEDEGDLQSYQAYYRQIEAMQRALQKK